MTSIDLLKFMLPDFLIETFEIVSTTNSEEKSHLYFKEKVKLPKEFDTVELVSIGFLNKITIQDFALRGKLVYLY